MSSNCYHVIIVKCHSNRSIFLVNSKMTVIPCSDVDFVVAQCFIKSSQLFSDADFTVAQCAIKSSQLFSDSDFAVTKFALKVL
jgi:hypothetical protein